MKRSVFATAVRVSLAVLLLASASPASLWACACGCGIFEVGTNSMFATQVGSMASVEYDFMDQDKNWSGNKRGSDDNNDDKQLESHFITLGYQHMFNRSWGFMAELPYTARRFATTDDQGGVLAYQHSAVGDIRVQGVYTGLSEDMSTGLTFGVKLPSGDYSYPDFDRDSAIGSGSTNALFGGYQMGRFPGSGSWAWFATGQADIPVLIMGGYRPGTELDAALGAYFDGWRPGGLIVAPQAQLLGSYRWQDSGVLADSPDSGYKRVVAAPGVEFDTKNYRIFANIGFPLYQYVNGNQLVASQFYKLNISYQF